MSNKDPKVVNSQTTVVKSIVNKEVSDWEERVFDAVLEMIAHPSFECNKDGSYQIEPLIEVVAQERQRVAESLFYKILEEYQPFDEKERALFRSYMVNLNKQKYGVGR